MFIKKIMGVLIVAAVLISAPLSVKADPIAATSTESNPLASVLNSPLAVQSVTNPVSDAAAAQALQAAQLQAAQEAQAAALKAAEEQAAQIQAAQAAQLKAAQDAQAAAIKAAQDQAAQIQAAQAAQLKAAQDAQAAAIKAAQDQAAQAQAAALQAAQNAAAAPISSANAAELAKTYPDFVYVSIGEQMAYMYRNGMLITSGPCVTGNASSHYDTTVGFHKIVFMDTNRTLHGSYGEAFVKYWMRFTNGGQGLHDAGWRKSFGGNIYKTNGSHGCVNLQRNVAATMYQYAYVGLPVIVMP